ncbi:MAG: TonB-dependent receptor [Bacteroidales bacterium]|nr:TonB-dependent receptor [Bacteroidales bacterium]
MKTVNLALSVCLASALSAQAAAPADSVSATLPELQVVETAKAPVTLLPLDVTTVSQQELARSSEPNILPVLVNRVPGMFVTERGMGGYGVSGGSAGTVNIRGVGQGNKVLFMIDGQPQWAGVFGHSLPDTYVTNDIERVEVVSGPSSLLYGSGAMGGSVNIITRRAVARGWHGAVSAAGGSYASQRYAARAGYRHERWHALAATSYESTKGNRDGMHYWLANQYLSAGYDISSHWEATASAMITETKAHNPGSIYEPLEEMFTRMTRTTASVYLGNRYGRTEGGIRAYYNWGRHKIDDGHAPDVASRTYLFNSKDYNMGVTAYQTVRPWQYGHLSAGIDFKHWGGRAWNSAKADGTVSPVSDAHVNEIAGYAMMQQGAVGNRLSLNAGVRLEHSSQFGNQWVPQAGFIARPVDGGSAKFSFGRGFRSPNIRELYMYAPRNPDLLPESMDNFEVELRQNLPDSRLTLAASLYYIKGRNMIQTVRTGGSPLNVNTGRFINKGFEAEASWHIDSRWTAEANYAYLHTNTFIVAAPRNKLFATLRYADGPWDVSVESLTIWHLPTEGSVENYSLLNARVAYSLPAGHDRLTLWAKGENLTAARYQINYGFPMPRATVMAGFDFNF